MKKSNNDNLSNIEEALKQEAIQSEKAARKLVEDWQQHFYKLTEMGKEIANNEFLMRKGLSFSCDMKTKDLKKATHITVNIACSLPKNLDV